MLDSNPNHFPTLLIICMIMSILLYVSASIVAFFHKKKRQTSKIVQVTKTNEELEIVPQQISEEEQQMENYLKDQENK